MKVEQKEQALMTRNLREKMKQQQMIDDFERHPECLIKAFV